MKTDKPIEVTITKPGILNGITGTIVEVNEQTGRAMIELADYGGFWLLPKHEYQLKQNNAPQALKSSETAKQINTDELTPAKIKAISKMGIKNVVASLEKSEPKKRGRKPKLEVKPIVQKRKYTKRK